MHFKSGFTGYRGSGWYENWNGCDDDDDDGGGGGDDDDDDDDKEQEW